MELKDIIDQIKKYQLREQEKMNYLKENISSSYFVAKLNFLAIENYQDSINTLGYVLSNLNDLQDRIISRNRNS